MRLIIKRDQEQKKGILGGNKGIDFKLHCQVELTPEESALIEKAKVGEYMLAEYTNNGVDLTLRVDGLTQGITSTVPDVQKLLGLEDEIKNGCQNLKSLLQVIGSFGGEEVIEI